jgi:hypothetical protein
MDKSEEHVFMLDLQGPLFNDQHKHYTLWRFMAHHQNHEKKLNPEVKTQTNVHVHPEQRLAQPNNYGERS